MRSYGEIFHDRISKTPLTEEAIKSAYAEMVKEQTEDWESVDPSERWNEGTPEELTRINLGYILGYYGQKTREFWYKHLPDVSHPVFGTGFGRGSDPTSEKAFEMGQKSAQGN